MGNTNSSNDIKNFFNNDVKNTASTFGKDLETMFMSPSNLMNSVMNIKHGIQYSIASDSEIYGSGS